MLALGAGKRVFLVSSWHEPIEPDYLGRAGRTLEGAAATRDFGEALSRTMSRLRANGARVYVWEPLPQAGFTVPEATARSMVFGRFWPIAYPLASWRRTMRYFYDALDRAGVPQDARFDPGPATCPNGECTFLHDGVPIYADGNHPAQHTMPWFADLLARGFLVDDRPPRRQPAAR